MGFPPLNEMSASRTEQLSSIRHPAEAGGEILPGADEAGYSTPLSFLIYVGMGGTLDASMSIPIDQRNNHDSPSGPTY